MINKIIEGYLPQLTAIRHDIHQHPELGFEEFRTSDLVADYLSSWGYEVHRGLAGTGVVGTLRVGDGVKRLGLRADMDALPIEENNGKPRAAAWPTACTPVAMTVTPPCCSVPLVTWRKRATSTARCT